MTPEVLTPFALEFWIDTGVALFCGAKDWREDHPTQWITILGGVFGQRHRNVPT